MSDPLQQFIDAMSKDGMPPAKESDIIADDKWRPYRIAHDPPKKKAGFYRLKCDQDFAVGNYGDRREGITHNWHSKLNGGGEYTDEERAAFKLRVEKQKQQKEQERVAREKEVAREAKVTWDGAEYARPDHPYLLRKNIKPHCFKQKDGKLLVPMYAEKRLWGYQTIDEEGDKLYLAGSRTKGCYCPLFEKGESFDVILFATGPATAATVREVSGLPTVVCFHDGNIAPVAERYRKLYPRSRFIIIADNDAWQKLKPTDENRVYVGEDHPKNSGIRHSEQAAAKVDYARVVWPKFEPADHPERPTDMNDAAALMGENYVHDLIKSAQSAPMPTPPPPVSVPKKVVPAPDSINGKVDWSEQLIVRDKHGNLAENSINYQLVVCNHPRLRHCFAYDEFHLCTMVVAAPPWVEDANAPFSVHALTETDIRNTDYFLQRLSPRNLKGSKEKTLDAIEECGLNNSFHPARDKLASLVWDGTPRLDNWLLTYLRAKDDPTYLRAIGSKWLIGAVKRLMEPGCQMDNMLVLEGAQDAGKSRTFRTLSRFGPPDNYHEYFMDTFNISNAEDTDELMKLSGSVIIEIQEMSGFNRKDDDAMKKFISTTHDTYRAPYGRRPQKWPRQFVLGGTYNPKDGIFKDSTGLKRYWMVETGAVIDLVGLERDREQLWAEAYHRYRQGESLVLSDEMKEMAKAAAEERRIVHVMTEEVLMVTQGRPFFTTKEILRELGVVLKLDQKSQSESFVVNDILRVNGFRRVKRTKGGASIWGWEAGKGKPVQREMNYTDEEQIDF